MKKILILIPLLFLSASLLAQQVPPRPNPPRLVNDLVGLLTPDQRQALENKVVAYDDSTSTQIAIVIVGTLNDYDPVDYAVKLGREWGIGGKQFNNGVIILISTGADGTQRKVFIATGYGLEGAIPDVTAKEIVDNDLVPYLKEKDYYRGLDLAVDAIISAAAGEYKAPEGYHKKTGRPIGGIAPLFVIIFIIIMLIARGGGRGGGGMMSRRGYRNRVGPSIWWLPLGGGWGSGGGGGWSGGGGGGGGFGGFGGGSFGGGGAGGSW
jgi:uncharacterized protein